MGKSDNTNSTQNGEPEFSVVASNTKKPKKDLGVHIAETAWRVAAPFFIFSLGGIWLDSRFDTDPLYSVIGVFVALAAVTVVVYKYVNKNFPETFKRGGGNGQ